MEPDVEILWLNFAIIIFSNILEISAHENKHATGQRDDIFHKTRQTLTTTRSVSWKLRVYQAFT